MAWKKKKREMFIIKEFGEAVCDTEVFIAQAGMQSK